MRYVKRFVNVIKKEGISEGILRVIRRMLSVPVALLIILLWPFIKIRLILLRSSRIGHYALNTHLMLCALESNDFLEEKKCVHFCYTQTSAPICNIFLHRMWLRVIRILPPWGAFWGHVDSILIVLLKEKYYSPFKQIFEGSEGAYDRWYYFKKNKKQFVFFNIEEKRTGEELKKQLGIPEGSLFVCLLVRDQKYLETIMPHKGWCAENFRDADIKNYIPAIQFLIKNGFYVVRMGKYVKCALDIGDKRFIDYANHPLKSDFLDIYLSAQCFFFIGTSNGLDSVPRIFHRPVVVTNAILFQLRSYLNWVFLIPKNVICLKTKSLIPYFKIYQDYVHFFLSGKYKNDRDSLMQEWEKRNWAHIENSSDEILSVVTEMLNYLTQSIVETSEMRKLQLLFWKNYPCDRALGETSYENVIMRISPSFLKKHYALMEKQEVNYG